MSNYSPYNNRDVNIFLNLWLNALIANFMGPTWGPSGADRTQVGPMLAPWNLLGVSTKRLLLVAMFKFTRYNFGHVMSQCSSTRYSIKHCNDKGRSLIKLLTCTRHPIQVCHDVTFAYLEESCYVWRLQLRPLLSVYKGSRAGVIWVVSTLICVRNCVFSNIFNNIMYRTVSVQVQLWYLSFSDN